MNSKLSIWLKFLITAAVLVSGRPAKRYYDTHAYYAVEYSHDDHSGIFLADVANALGVEVVEQAGELRDVWLVRVPQSHREARQEAHGYAEDPVLHAFKILQATATSHLAARSEDRIFARQVTSSVKFLERQTPRTLMKRAPPPIHSPSSASSFEVAKRLGLKDPLFHEQWHLVNDWYPQHSMNTTPVWDMGFTGKGIFTSFLDDGLDFEHDDLKDAFDAENSYDFNEHVPLPRPVTAIDDHGTRCAGQVAARRNDACGVGIAFEAKAAGVRILGGPISYVDEASALNYGFQKVSIYSCSWGPRDDGRRMDGPGYLVRKAVVNGINEGREGKGSIFVFASGNGGDSHDQCNFDGYTNSIYSVTVSTVDYKGLHPSYSETCAANLIVAYSSGSGKHIVTTDRSHNGDNKCTYGHSGTSAAAPNAVGVFALALQARPELTWRDIQHLCVETARVVDPEDPDWERTAAGRLYNNKFGYGALDAYAYVKAAQTWNLVKPQAWLHSETIQVNGGRTHDYGHGNYTYEGGERIRSHGFESMIHITKEMVLENNLEFLEHINVRVWISHSRRGDVEVELISPNGVKSVLARKRPFDDATTGYPGWRFMTVKHWGEDPVGQWTIRVFDQDDQYERGKFLGWNMVFWGSSIDPSKAVKYQEPIVDNILPPVSSPHRPIVNDPVFTSTTQHAKPTEHLPPDHLQPTDPAGETQPTGPSSPGPQTPLEALVSSQKWRFMSIVAALGLLVSLLFYLWRRRVARKRLVEYTSLAADDIHMDAVVDSRVIPIPHSRGTPAISSSSDDFQVNEDSEPFLPPPTTARLGFHSGFLDDEPSPPGYRDRPGRAARQDASNSNSERNLSYGGAGDENSPWLVVG